MRLADERGLYHADGQMLDEVYNYGSFKQSKMFAAGVTCSDCHEPHSAKLRAPADGVCLQCHASDKYAVAAHQRHEAVNPPLSCASCHMPARTYMVVDERHDHSFRVPRPDVSAKLGTPNACNDCHGDKSPNGRRRQSSAGTVRTERACKITPRLSMQRRTGRSGRASGNRPPIAMLRRSRGQAR